MDKVVLQAADLDGYLTRADQDAIAGVGELYDRAQADFLELERGKAPQLQKAEERLAGPFQ